MCAYHIPALLNECMMGLDLKPDGDYVDVTYGGGGHSKEILKSLNNGRLFSFDQDLDAFKNEVEDRKLTLIHGNFRFIKNFLRFHGVNQVDGIIADLGISFHQVDEMSRGFSYKSDAEIDMRMNINAGFKASDIINDYPAEKLASVLNNYGELHNGWKIAQAILETRAKKKFVNIGELVKLLEKFVPKRMENKFYAKVFQALRIEVNKEMDALKEFLEQTPALLKKGGRLVVISYHSLEDRLVKNFMKSGNFEGKIDTDVYGHFETPFSLVNRKVIIPSESEINLNTRSRSAKLRIAEKN